MTNQQAPQVADVVPGLAAGDLESSGQEVKKRAIKGSELESKFSVVSWVKIFASIAGLIFGIGLFNSALRGDFRGSIRGGPSDVVAAQGADAGFGVRSDVEDEAAAVIAALEARLRDLEASTVAAPAAAPAAEVDLSAVMAMLDARFNEIEADSGVHVEYIEVPGAVRYVEVPVPGAERVVTVTQTIYEDVEVNPLSTMVAGQDLIVCIQVEKATAVRVESASGQAGREWGLVGGDCHRLPAPAVYNEFRLIVTR